MAIKEDLIYFLKNGRLENINFGNARKQLFEILGEPHYVNPSKHVDLYMYDCFEFYIQKEKWKEYKSERLSSIAINRPKK